MRAIRQTVLLGTTVLALAASGLAADDREAANQVRMLLREKKFEEAEKTFHAALKADPQSDVHRQSQFVLYLYLNRAGQAKKALRYLDGYVDYQFDQAVEHPELVRGLSATLSRLLDGYDRTQQASAADLKLAYLAKRAELLVGQGQPLPTLLRGRQAVRLARRSKYDEAVRIMNEQIVAARIKLAESPADPDFALQVAALLQMRLDVEVFGQGKRVAQTREALLAFVAEQAARHRDNPSMVSSYVTTTTRQIGHLVSRDPDKAEKLLHALENFMGLLDKRRQELRTLSLTVQRQIPRLRRRIATGQRHLALTGKPAPAWAGVRWLNAEPPGSDALQGKVILLNFWAVWCEPCLASFPKLRTWHEKYADQGLVIVGLTRYYREHGWDPETRKLTANAHLEPRQEREMLQQFADHHQLRHRLAVVPNGSRIYATYAVTTLPETVVIDRRGRIRLVQVGAGRQGHQAIEAMIQKCLDE